MSDNWDFYPLLVEDAPASIFVNLGIAAEAPIRECSQLVSLRLYMQAPREDGLSSQEEFERLCEVEDGLEIAVEEVADIIFVGRITADGCRDFFFYASNATAAESRLSQAMVPFGEYEFEIGVHEDDDWGVYFRFLYPDPRQQQIMKNNRVLAWLAEKGDNCEVVREVSHWIYFPTAENRADFLASTASEGYELVDQQDDVEGGRPYSLILRHFTAVDYSTITNAILWLFDLAEMCQGNYDGWETSVECG